MKVSDHVIDFDSKLIEYDKRATNDVLLSLLKALKSNLPIKRVDCLRLRSLSLTGLATLFEIGSIKQSVMGLEISPHCVDVENGVFCFSPKSPLISLLKKFRHCSQF
ncbi:hypothetical protein GEMRC1_009533 [Eukaryota sp. GEM-RC1]